MLDGKSFPSPECGSPPRICHQSGLFLVFINTLADLVTNDSSIALFADDCLFYRKIDRNRGDLNPFKETSTESWIGQRIGR